jgi:hypothetical protein
MRGAAASRKVVKRIASGSSVRTQCATIIVLLAAAQSACGGRGPVPALHEGLHAASAEITVAEAVVASGSYRSGAVEVLVSRTQLRILISDRRLAEGDPASHAAAAVQAVATAERTLATDPEFPTVQTISVAIVHPPSLRSGTLASHIEDVFEFRRGAGGDFGAPHG